MRRSSSPGPRSWGSPSVIAGSDASTTALARAPGPRRRAARGRRRPGNGRVRPRLRSVPCGDGRAGRLLPAMSSRVLVVFLAATAGCSLFKELQDAESAEDSGSGTGTSDTGSDETDDADDTGSDETSSACELPDDDRCLDQDTLQTCDPDSGVLTEYACADLCAGTPNFTCLIAASDGRHGCWCVTPGPQKVLSCTELEACLGDCSGAADTSCA